jgi:signal transduction histidine kinase
MIFSISPRSRLVELEAIPFSLSGLVTATLETFRPQVVAKGLTLDAEIDAGSQDALVGDPTRVRQILFNLLSNAIKFTERGGVRVRVGTAALGEGNTRATHEVALRQYGFWAECGSSAISAHCTDRRGHYGCNVS